MEMCHIKDCAARAVTDSAEDTSGQTRQLHKAGRHQLTHQHSCRIPWTLCHCRTGRHAERIATAREEVWQSLPPAFCKCGRRRKTGAKCAVHKDENCFPLDPTWAQDVCVKREMSLSCPLYQAVMWPLCNNNTLVQQARLLARRPSLHRKFTKIYACSHVSIFRLVQSIILVSRDIHSHTSPLPFARWTRLAQLSTHAKHWSQSVESLASQCFRSSVTRIHIGLDWWHRYKFPKYQNFEWIGSSCECVSSCGSHLVSLPLSVLCCCLLSRVSRMIVQFLPIWLVRKSTLLTVHQEHTILILHWTRQQSFVLDILPRSFRRELWTSTYVGLESIFSKRRLLV